MGTGETTGAPVLHQLPAVQFAFIGGAARVQGTVEVRRHALPGQLEQIALDVKIGDTFVGTVVLDLDAALDLALQTVGFAIEIRTEEEP